jgi:hypothetical protein
MAPDLTIFEYLTTRNPPIASPQKAKRPSSKRHKSRPLQLRKWDDFNMETIRNLYDKRLMEEASRKTSHLLQPVINPHECKCHDHSTTMHLLGQWTLSKTKNALQLVKDSLHPATWSGETRQRQKLQPPNRRRRSASYIGTRKRRKRPFEADASTIVLCRPCQIRDVRTGWRTRERLPKEVKHYPLFDSSRIEKMLDPEGFWDPSVTQEGDRSQVAQAFDYCVMTGCRYGCILSAFEAFIFRVTPLKRPPESFEEGSREEQKAMQRSLNRYGLMEYQAIPWSTYRKGDCDNFHDLTVNFSLFVLHVLAGNAHDIKWEYADLLDEALVPQPCSLPQPETPGLTPTEYNEETPIDGPNSAQASFMTDDASRKRHFEEMPDTDQFHLSFQQDGSHGDELFNLYSLTEEERTDEESSSQDSDSQDDQGPQRGGFRFSSPAILRRSPRLAENSTSGTRSKRARKE